VQHQQPSQRPLLLCKLFTSQTDPHSYYFGVKNAHRLTGFEWDVWIVLFGAILATILAVEQQTKAILVYIQESLSAFLFSSLIFSMALVLSSGTLR
jgi:hypothetical protein